MKFSKRRGPERRPMRVRVRVRLGRNESWVRVKARASERLTDGLSCDCRMKTSLIAR